MSAGIAFLIESINIVSFSFDSKMENKNLPSKIEIEPRLSTKYRLDHKRAVVNLSIDLSGENVPFSFSLCAKGNFVFDKIPEKKWLDRIVHTDCLNIMFPFLREFVAEITRRAGFPPLILPFMNFTALLEDHFKEKKASKT